MKSNKPSSTRRHASLKNIDRNFTSENRRIILAIILPIIVIALGYFAYCGLSKVYDKLSAIRNTQSLIVDESAQITIKASPHFPEANIKELFKLKKGTRLADIDFEKCREKILKKYPILSNITIHKKLPNKVTICVEERKPMARVNYEAGERVSWLVVDSNGVVFNFPLNDSHTLPIIKQAKPYTLSGEKIQGKAQLALRLIEFCSIKDISNIQLTEIDVSDDLFLIAKTRDYNRIDLLWEYIYTRGEHDLTNLQDAITKISSIIKNNLKTGHYQTFIVTGKNRVTVSPNEKEYIK